MITISEIRYVRSREVAVKIVKESAKAHEIWLVSRVANKKRAIEIQSQVFHMIFGTLEKRCISGEQRKQVNVGLELVMEPLLLFLDEPTSGLDNSSSQLLLRVLRREALE